MAEKIFMKRDGIVLRGDDRDFMLPAQYKMAVLRWCRLNHIDIECPLSQANRGLARGYFGMDIWRVKDEKQRMWFMLRWS